MSLIPWRRGHRELVPGFDPWFDRFFDRSEPFGQLPEVFHRGNQPAMNVSEDPDAYIFTFELPGLTEEDIQVQVLGNQLQISGERRFEEEKKEQEFHRVESQYGTFLRTVMLPPDLKTDHVEATYKKGILSVRIPKVAPTPAKKIPVCVE